MGKNKRTVKKKIKDSLFLLGSKVPALGRMLRCLQSLRWRIIYRRAASAAPVDDRKILFESYKFRHYSCSPKAIYEYMINDERFSEYRFVWAFGITFLSELERHLANEPLLSKAEIVRYGTPEFRREYASSKYIITNSRLPEYFIKKDAQIVIQCWHGTPFKKLAYDAACGSDSADLSAAEVHRLNDDNVAKYTYMLSQSKTCTDRFKSAFQLERNNPDLVMIEEGYPRNDALVNIDRTRAAKVKERLGIKADEKRRVILYAPTWRESSHQPVTGYIYDMRADFGKWRDAFGKDFIVLFRAHYLIAEAVDFSEYGGFLIDVSDENDINDLYIISDMMITDYSSSMFDYAVLRRPILFYMYDLDEYKDSARGLYEDVSELPGEICRTEEALINAVVRMNFDAAASEKYERFKDKYTGRDDGRAASRVVNKIFA